MDHIILVDKKDREIGYEEKDKCHSPKTKLHRAFSVFLFNKKGEMLITQRSAEKKTWPLHWSNACCSHPRKGEIIEDAALRRLREELGIKTELRFLFKFEYKAQYNKEWGEHEIDHVFVGFYDDALNTKKEEISDWKFVSPDELKKNVKNSPDSYTPWFKIVFERVIDETVSKKS